MKTNYCSIQYEFNKEYHCDQSVIRTLPNIMEQGIIPWIGFRKGGAHNHEMGMSVSSPYQPAH